MQRNNLQDIGTWSFSGVVVDGSSGKALGDVEISYVDEDGTQQSEAVDGDGKFFINGLPFGERTFEFSSTDSDNSYTSIRITVASWAEASTLGGVIGDVSRIVKLYPLTGSVSGNLMYQPKGTEYHLPAANASIRIFYQDSTMKDAEPAQFSTATDSTGYFKVSDMPFAPGCIIIFDDFIKKEVTYTLPAEAITLFSESVNEDMGKMVFTTDDSTELTPVKLISNVLSDDGFGKDNVPVNQTIWYILPVSLDENSISVKLNGFGPPSFNTRVSGDTVFILPVAQLAFDTLIEVAINGVTEDNERFELTLDNSARFRTEKSPFPLEANFWSQPGVLKGRFGIGQEVWVRFSVPLDTVPENIKWAASSAGATVYGTGSNANATFRISDDTLFVTPDQRLQFVYNSTFGFNVQCKTIDGRYLQYYDFGVNTIEDPLYIVWTNTKDGMGNSRVDMGLRDTLKVVASVSDFKVVGVSVGDTGIIPPGLMLADIKKSDDTIICIPSLSLQSDTAYSIDFDLQFDDGTIRRDVLGIVWSTKNKVTIVGTDTKVNGMYRPLTVIGDSFSVTFSEPIDTSSNAAVVFRVTIQDVNDEKKRTMVSWDKKCCTATIKILDTLPAADFDAPAAYTATATATRAVEDVTFDLVTMAGEQVLQCRPQGDPIELHTEKGLCVVNTNIVSDLDGRTAVEDDFSPSREFPLDGVIEVKFNRAIDTASMNMDSIVVHAAIHKVGAVIVPSVVTVLKDMKTIRIDPVDRLEMKTDYYIYLQGIPGRGIAGAAPINRHGGTFSGRAGAAYLFDRPFKTQ